MQRTLTLVLGCAGLAMISGACVVRTYATVPADASYVAGDDAATYTVHEYPPEPLYEEVSVSPGYGHVWLDGNWHWNGYRWVWITGRWVPDRVGYVYVAPYYDYVDGRYVYRGGHWSDRRRLPRDVVVYDRRDGRPATYSRDRRDNRYDYRPSVRDQRDRYDDRRGHRPDVRDNRGYHRPERPDGPSYQRPQRPDVHDNRGYRRERPEVRDNRAPYNEPRAAPARSRPDVRDHRAPSRPDRVERERRDRD